MELFRFRARYGTRGDTLVESRLDPMESSVILVLTYSFLIFLLVGFLHHLTCTLGCLFTYFYFRSPGT